MSAPFDDSTGTEQTNDGNPAWQEFLDVVPSELHSQVTPLLEKWDKGVQDRFQKVHSQYEPWKPIFDAGIDPDTAQFALNLLNSINDNPKLVWEAIGNYHKFNTNQDTSGNGSGEQGQLEPTIDDPYDQRVSNIERQNQIMAAHLLQQREEALEAEAMQQLDQELSDLRTKYKSQGEFSEPYVLALMQNGYDSEDAVKMYYEFRDAELKKYGQKPLIMGAGGGIPQINTDVRKLDESGTKNLVVQMLQAAASQRNQ